MITVSSRAKGVEYAIRDVVIPAKKLEAAGHKVLNLNIGDPDRYDFDTPDHVKNAAVSAIKHAKNYYGDSQGEKEVLEAVKEHEKASNGREPDSVLLTAGVSEAVNFLMASLVEKGEEVLIPGPSYPQYISLCKFFGGKPVEYSCREDDAWNPSVEDVENKITKQTRALVVINPNNPTGAVYSKKTLAQIAKLAKDNNLLLISDEIYDRMILDGDYSSLSAIARDQPLVTLNGISKNYLAPGWRVGYAAFRNCDEIADACMRQARVRLSINTPSALAFAAALRGPHDHLKEVNRKLRERRDFVFKRANEIPGMSLVKPKGAFYAFPRVDGVKDDKAWVLDLLHKKHVLTVFGSGFGEYGRGHFRVVFLPPLQALETAFEKIDEFCRGK
jgi:aspartate/methionine/tyrosine aminotransferase